MDYSIRPSKHELQEVRQKVEQTLDSFEYALDIDSVEINLGWQKIENDVSIIPGEGNSLVLIINPEREIETLERNILRGVLEIEFLQKAEFEEITYNWQEVLKFAYVKNKVAKLLDEETGEQPSLEEKWPDLKENLSEKVEEFSEEFYLNAAPLGNQIGKKLLETHEMEEIPNLKRSDVTEAGEELFG